MKWVMCKKCNRPTMAGIHGACRMCGGQIGNKNNAVLVHFGGHVFKSRAEHDRYQVLMWKEKSGFVRDVTYRPKRVWLAPRVGWDVDFHYFDIEKGCHWYEEFKGKEEADYRIKRDLWRFLGPEPIRIVVKAKDTGLFCVDEEIIPAGLEAMQKELIRIRAA